jgi:hypothetical protein
MGLCYQEQDHTSTDTSKCYFRSRPSGSSSALFRDPSQSDEQTRPTERRTTSTAHGTPEFHYFHPSLSSVRALVIKAKVPVF